jgi:hypothetical protein
MERDEVLRRAFALGIHRDTAAVLDPRDRRGAYRAAEEFLYLGGVGSRHDRRGLGRKRCRTKSGSFNR